MAVALRLLEVVGSLGAVVYLLIRVWRTYKVPKGGWLPVMVLACLPTVSAAATYSASSCNNTAGSPHVQDAVTLATNDGDTVAIPAGNCSWTQTVTTTKAIHIIGAGSGTDTGSNTVITDNVPGATYGRRNLRFSVPCNKNAAMSVKNMRWVQGTVDSNYGFADQATIAITSGSHALVIQNIAIINTDAVAIYLNGDIWGVLSGLTIDHTSVFRNGVLVYHPTWGGVVNDPTPSDSTCNLYGDKSWSSAHTMGTEQAIFIEASTFYGCVICNGGGKGLSGSVNDMYDGGRLVFRHNTVYDDFIQGHGVEHSRSRGGRQLEMYNNTFNDTCNGGCFSVFGYLKSGTGLIYNNIITGYASNSTTNGFALLNSRDNDGHTSIAGNLLWGACGQPISWDDNGTTLRSGTAQAGSATDSLVDSGFDWTTLAVADGVAITNTTVGWTSVMLSRTSSTVTTQASIYGGAHAHTWTTGDSYTAQAAYPCLDQVGYGGGGVLLSGTNPSPTAINQDAEPWYVWGNSRNGSPSNTFISTTSPRIQSGRDYIIDTARPGWTPYTYPHPLISGSAAPSNFRIAMRMVQLSEWALPVLGISWHFRHAILVGCLTVLSVGATCRAALSDYTTTTHHAMRAGVAKAILAVLPTKEDK